MLRGNLCSRLCTIQGSSVSFQCCSGGRLQPLLEVHQPHLHATVASSVYEHHLRTVTSVPTSPDVLWKSLCIAETDDLQFILHPQSTSLSVSAQASDRSFHIPSATHQWLQVLYLHHLPPLLSISLSPRLSVLQAMQPTPSPSCSVRRSTGAPRFGFPWVDYRGLR